MLEPLKLLYPKISGRLIGYHDVGTIEAGERVVDLLIQASTHSTYSAGSDVQFYLRRRDMRDPDEWTELNGRTILDGLALQQLELSRGVPTESGPARKWTSLVDVRVFQGSSNGNTDLGLHPTLSRELRGARPFLVKGENFKR